MSEESNRMFCIPAADWRRIRKLVNNKDMFRSEIIEKVKKIVDEYPKFK
jgi:hypothetical protein